MSTEKCRKTNCPHYQWKGASFTGGDVSPLRGRCMLTHRMVNRMKECPMEAKGER